ncbi:MAG: nitrous oxide reductase accessory protein NosL [Deltaproteobacteria bacterium]|nr:MAG: nitrous oxide reductase accessory protein NosL [Deltaproteobacteria bacterium]
MKYLQIVLALLVLTNSGYAADDPGPKKPGPTDKCPVCGMFVAKYPDFVACLVFKDGSQAFFDGVKDLMKYYFGLAKYNPAKKTADIAAIHLTDYYSLKLIDGRQAYYVVGSDVFGPMGRELIPLAEETAAKEFLKDHNGKSILTFPEITKALIGTLD